MGRPRRGWRTAAALFAAALLLLSAPAEAQRRGGGGRPGAGPSHSERTDGRYGSGRAGDQRTQDPFQAADAADPLLAGARDHHRDHREDFVRSEAFRDDLPFLRVRLPRSTSAYDERLKDYARERLTAQLDSKLSIEDITIIEADFSARDDVQAMASRDFRDSIPAARRRMPPALGALQRGGEARPSIEEIRQALAPHRGQVLVLAGHIDENDGTMSWTRGRRRTVIDVKLWMEAADRAGVMLLTLGCYSSHYSSVGSPFALNSHQLVGSLAAMLAAEPASYADMYRSLGGPEGLVLDFDPFQATLAYQRLDISGEAGVQGIVYWNPGLLESNRAAGGVGPDPQRPCGASRDAVELARCDAAHAAAGPVRDAEYSLAFDREELDKARRLRWIGLLVFLAAIFPVAAAVALSMRSRLMPDDDWEPGDQLAELGEDSTSDRPFLADYRTACIGVGLLHLAGLAVALTGSWAGTIALNLDLALWGISGLILLAWSVMKTGKPGWAWFAVALSAAAYLPYAGAVNRMTRSSAAIAYFPARIAGACAEIGPNARYVDACRR